MSRFPLTSVTTSVLPSSSLPHHASSSRSTATPDAGADEGPAAVCVDRHCSPRILEGGGKHDSSGEQSPRTPTSSTRLLLLGFPLARSPCHRSAREGWRRVEGWSGGGSPGDSATSRSTPESSAAQNIWQWDSSRHSSALPSSQFFAKIHHPHSIFRQFLEPAPSVSNRDSV